MATRIQNGAGGLISHFYKDITTGKPKTEERTETQTVTTQSFVALKEIPYKFTRVRISDYSMIEVDNADEITTSKNYYVDYNNYDGKIHFHPSTNGTSFVFTYDSIGYVITTSSRIATQWDGTTVIETLSEMMDTMNDAILVSTTYANANALIIDIEARTLACKNAIDTKITEANNKITDVNTTITNANTARTNLQATIDSGGLTSYQTKTDNTLATTSKLIVGAINENKTSIGTNATNIANNTTAISNHTTSISTNTNSITSLSNALGVNTSDIARYSKPYIEGSISITMGVGETVKSTSVVHGLGYAPRNMMYTKLSSGGNIYLYPFPYITYVVFSSASLTIATMGRGWVSNNTVEVVFNRPSDLATVSETFDIKYYLFKD